MQFMPFVRICVDNVWIPLFLHSLHSVFHHGPMVVIFQEYAHSGHSRGFTEVMPYLLLLQLFKKAYLFPSPLSLWDKISVMYCNLVSVLADVQFRFLIGGCDAYLDYKGT